eukprot:m.23244 g.23244  ORF g.23244 m.23244 type:complete len:70 (+) comp8466_c1_seq1:84-293(+)
MVGVYVSRCGQVPLITVAVCTVPHSTITPAFAWFRSRFNLCFPSNQSWQVHQRKQKLTQTFSMSSLRAF